MAGTLREIMMVDLRQSELFAWQNRFQPAGLAGMG